MRSAARAKNAAASTGKTRIARIEVTSVFQVKIDMRHMVIPGARIVMIVVMKLTPPRIVPKPLSPRPSTHRLPPTPGENVAPDSGVYANQPKEAAPCGVRKPPTAISEPNVYSQK